ncbi:MAG: MerR family transcriptional regulator [Romboutsia sp.]
MLLTVGQISKLFNITTETLRHYDRVGILKPIIDKKNGYRYYSWKEMEILEFIVEAKYLEIPLIDIKETIGKNSISSQLDLIELQESIIEKKIKHLKHIKRNAEDRKATIKEILNFENIYDFEKLDIVKKEKKIILAHITNLVNGKIKQKDSTLRNLYIEEWMLVYRTKDINTIVFEEDYIGIDLENAENVIIEYDKKNKEVSYSGKFVKVKFYGDIDEIEKYIKCLLKYFYKDLNNIEIYISAKYIWTVYMEEESKYFMEISIPIN